MNPRLLHSLAQTRSDDFQSRAQAQPARLAAGRGPDTDRHSALKSPRHLGLRRRISAAA
jgi:hypothetical protein